MHGFDGGFEYAAREARRELLEEAREWRLARLARPKRGLGGRLADLLRVFGGFTRSIRPESEEARGFDAGGTPDFVYLTDGKPGTAVEIYLRAGGCVVRKMNLRTGASTDAFVADGPLRR